MMNSPTFTVGQRVRVITDPGRIGFVGSKERFRNEHRYLQVTFQDGTSQYVPENHLEHAAVDQDDPLDLFEGGLLGRPQDLRRALTHTRLSGRLANIIYSMDVTATDFHAYQFKPLIKLLNSATSGMLIADEVGLGKTIEAGLIWTELRSRFDYQRLVVICPKLLREKWERELRRRFGVQAELMSTSDLLDRLRRANEDRLATRFAAICSLQGIRGRRISDEDRDRTRKGPSARLADYLETARDQQPLIDLLIIDEAHYLRNPDTATAHAGKLLRDVSEYVLLLSATPIHLKSDDLFNLVRLADPDTFESRQTFSDMLSANAPLVEARELVVSGAADRDQLETSLERAKRHPLLTGSQQLEQLISTVRALKNLKDPEVASAIAYRLENVNLLGHVVTRTKKRDVKEWRVVREPRADSIQMSAIEKAFYDGVTDAIREYAANSKASEGFLLVMPQRQMASSMPAAFAAWRQRQLGSQAQVYEDFGGLETRARVSNDIGPLTQHIISRVESIAEYEALRANDSKYQGLLTLLRHFTQTFPGDKLVLFSYFLPTLKYLESRLRHDGVQCALLHGDIKDKQSVIQAFQLPEGPPVLLSSEVGSEGIDLQFCWVVVNYDLPWNPMKVEQRIGRLDRLGQMKNKIVIRNFFCDDTVDARIYKRLYARLDLFRRSLGTLEPILGDIVKELAIELITQKLTPEQEEERIDQTRRALENRRAEEDRLESEAAHLVAYGDYIVTQVHAARELGRRISESDLRDYVCDFLNLRYPGCSLRDMAEDGVVDVTLTPEARAALEAFIHDRRLPQWTNLTRGAARSTACRFESTVFSSESSRVESINQFHPLVRFVSESMRASEFQNRPAVAVRLDQRLSPRMLQQGQYLFAIQLWSMKGIQEVELLYYSATSLEGAERNLSKEDAERLVSAAQHHGSDWLSAAQEIDLDACGRILSDHCLASADAAYEKQVSEFSAQNSDRALLQEVTLKRRLESQLADRKKLLGVHRFLGRESLARAIEGQIRALEERTRQKMLSIAERKKFTHSKQDICVGVIEVV